MIDAQSQRVGLQKVAESFLPYYMCVYLILLNLEATRAGVFTHRNRLGRVRQCSVYDYTLAIVELDLESPKGVFLFSYLFGVLKPNQESRCPGRSSKFKKALGTH